MLIRKASGEGRAGRRCARAGPLQVIAVKMPRIGAPMRPFEKNDRDPVISASRGSVLQLRALYEVGQARTYAEKIPVLVCFK
jgi:hypothetical protein